MFTLLLSFAILWMGVTSRIVSRGKPTSSSALYYKQYSTSLAVDGNYNTDMYKGSCFHTMNDAAPFFMVDLKGHFRIDHVVLYNRMDGSRDRIVGSVIELLSSNNTVIHQCGKLNKYNTIYDFPCRNKVAAKVRVRGAPKQFLHFCEFEVHGEPISSLISRNKPTTHSRQYGDMDGSLAVDGNYINYINANGTFDLRHCFMSEEADLPVFVIDLQGTFSIERVVLHNRADCCSNRMINAAVELLFDNDELSHACADITKSKLVYNITCEGNVAQKVRIVGAPKTNLQLCEVDVYGTPMILPGVISRNKPTTHSDTYCSLDSGLVVDGVYNNFLDQYGVYNLRHCFHSTDEPNTFLTVDLEDKYSVSHIVITNRMDCCSQRIIGSVVELLSQDETVIHECGRVKDGNATARISCGDKPAHKVRIRPRQNEFLQICELEVFGEPAISIISRGKPTSCSSVHSEMEGAYAVDGRYQYNFTDENEVNLFHSNNDEVPFWEVDLQGKFIIDHVAIYNRVDCCTERLLDATIHLLTETGEVGHECGKVDDIRVAYKIDCDDNEAHKVRITGPPNEYLHFIEVDVFGDNA